MEEFARTEFAPATTYVNTAGGGLLPARAATALHAAVDSLTGGLPSGSEPFEAIAAARESFARIAGVPADRVAAGSSVSVHVALIAASAPEDAEVLVADGDFSSLITPFAIRPGVRLRSVPASRFAAEIRPSTWLAAVSSVRFTDGRMADLAAIREAAGVHGVRTLVDTTQGTGWAAPCAGDFDLTVCGAFKWLMCPRGVSFLTIPEDAAEWLEPGYASWMSAADLAAGAAGVLEPATGGRGYDQSVPFLPYIAGQHSLALLEELGTKAVGAHNTALADRFRAGLTALGHPPWPSPGSAIVSVPGLGAAAPRLAQQGIVASDRGGSLRCSFHLYNTAADVDRVLDALAGLV